MAEIKESGSGVETKWTISYIFYFTFILAYVYKSYNINDNNLF